MERFLILLFCVCFFPPLFPFAPFPFPFPFPLFPFFLFFHPQTQWKLKFLGGIQKNVHTCKNANELLLMAQWVNLILIKTIKP